MPTARCVYPQWDQLPARLQALLKPEARIHRPPPQVLAQTQRMAVSTVLAVKNAGSAAAAEVVLCEPAVLQERAAMYEVCAGAAPALAHGV